MKGSQFLQSLQSIRHEDEALVLLRNLGIIDNGKGATLLECLHGIVVTVERFALQGKENAVLRALAAVRSHHRMLAVNGI